MWLDQRDIALEEIEQPAQLALNISVETVAPLQTLRSLLNMAELRLLQGDRALALAFWRECVDACVFRSLSLPLSHLRSHLRYLVWREQAADAVPDGRRHADWAGGTGGLLAAAGGAV